MVVKTAKVYRLYGPRDLHLDIDQIPNDSEGFLCKTIYSGISVGTELAAFLGYSPLRKGSQYPRLQGYLNVSQVIDCIDKSNSIKNKRSLLEKYIITYKSHRDFFILKETDFYLLLPENDINPKFALAYIYHLALSAILKANYSYNDKIFVYGSGLISLAAIQLYKRLGLKVYCITRSHQRIDYVKRAGAIKVFVETDEGILSSRISSDIAVITSNSWTSWTLALKKAAPHSRISVLGFPGRNEKIDNNFNPLNPIYTYTKQLSIYFCGELIEKQDTRYILRNTEFQNMCSLVDDIYLNNLDAESLISSTYNWRNLNELYLRLAKRNPNDITFILDWTK